MTEEVIFEKEYNESSIADIEEDIFDAIRLKEPNETYIVIIKTKKVLDNPDRYAIIEE